MKKSWAALLGTLAVMSVLLVGCTKDNVTNPGEESVPANVTDEQSARIELAKSDGFVQNDEITMSDLDMQPTDYGTFGKVNASITPLRWGRFVTSVMKIARDTVYTGDTIAVVHIDKEISGLLRIRATNTAGDTVAIEKPFEEESDRNIVFKRVDRNAKRYWLNWMPVASSLVKGGTSDGKIGITELKLKSATDSITITDPLTYFLRYRWLRWYNGGEKPVPQLNGGGRVTMQVTLISSALDTDIVVLRCGASPFQRRRVHMTLLSQQQMQDGTYERIFTTSWSADFHAGFFHAGVDAITKETVFDDAAPYSASWWGVPYRVF